MPALFVFLLKVNIALLLFCAGYYLVLRHLTFYTLNRVYLVAAILFASIYPQINLSGFVQRHQEFTKPVQAVAINWQAPANALIKPLTQPDYWRWTEVIFWAGAALLALRLLSQLYSLFKLYRSSVPAQIHDHHVRVLDGEAGPFSFWKSIYINPNNYEPADLKAILLHEQVHVNEWHTLDILLAELSTIFYWFNPGVWLMKKAVRENIEFITDRKILKKGVDAKQYQYSLVNVSFAASPHTLVNHFNISTIKKRIIMMNAKRSSKFNLTRYAFLVPAVIALLLVFSISKAALIKKSAGLFKVAAPKTISKKIEARHLAEISVPTPAKAKQTVTAPTGVIDTVKTGNTAIKVSGTADSLNYVINGVKATKAEFKALDPDHIYAVEVVSAERAKKIFDQLNNDHSVLFVTTDDSEAGKKFKERIDELNNNSYTLAAKVSSWNSDPAAIALAGKAEALSMTLPRVKYRIDARKKAHTLVKADGKWVITENNEPLIALGDSTRVHAKALKNILKTYTLDSRLKKGKFDTMFYAAPRHALTYTPKVMVTGRWNFNNETNIRHLPGKMIMIDGKEASESDLKKLSAANIESMSVKLGDEVTKQYGEKAKNGIVFIETKKAAH
ncbi:MAG TPA: M56 family metallopeptidase [Mucilaginibacter sp.]|jgi:bla regulator protein BlaR1|nr:M56 family metallopeptidase [Mucilaginibacter sp.]